MQNRLILFYILVSISLIRCKVPSTQLVNNNPVVPASFETKELVKNMDEDNIAVAKHPSLSLTNQGVVAIKSELGNVPLFDKQLAQTQQEIDIEISKGIDVPIPKDMAGGYSHEQHKKNYKIMQKAGNLYQLTGDEKYATFVKEMLLEYADMYPSLPLHPTMRSYSTGKIFWQCLNDANWLVFTSQAYDCIYEYLSGEERHKLESELFIPFANFLSDENPKFFNRIHNHSTWGNAAVGMIAP